jgi:hypothetical protein
LFRNFNLPQPIELIIDIQIILILMILIINIRECFQKRKILIRLWQLALIRLLFINGSNMIGRHIITFLVIIHVQLQLLIVIRLLMKIFLSLINLDWLAICIIILHVLKILFFNLLVLVCLIVLFNIYVLILHKLFQLYWCLWTLILL